jgi:hypothetical protein
MISFKFIETFFILSLGVSLLLMMLLIYHFKQRLYKTEEKVDTLFDIIQNLAQEVSSVRNNVAYMVHSQTNYGNNNPFTTSFPLQFVNMDDVKNDVQVHELDMEYQDLGELDITNHLEHIVELNDEDDEDVTDEDDEDVTDEDDEDVTDEDDEDDEEDEEDEEDDEENDNQLISEFIKIKIQDDEPMEHVLITDLITDNLHIVEEVPHTQIISEEEQEELLLIGDFDGVREVQLSPDLTSHVSSQPDELVVTDDGEPQVDDIESYKKMSLSMLKQIVLTKGLVKDVSRLKKPELLKLLSNSPSFLKIEATL